ncbi:hypothetical protein [Paenibacillus montanisoli]|uniref:Uncharacterized protein n=1 Tax=Paenibacillus montanisoli TaxID=2081970 RepID=A0A328UD29_9BACL|nr:hypothetical protein [Paenibacillus montanisoli]RAP78244.1 hypothetical protein DL346_07400 [Paenibacillus montanisoli]
MYSTAAAVLTPTEIHKIRHYVQHKYGDLPSDRRAEIVDDELQRIVMRQLPRFPQEDKRKVTAALLRSLAASKPVSVSEKHIFAACMRLDYRDPQLLHALHEWVEQRIGVTIERETFKEIVDEAARIARSPQLEVEAWDAILGRAAAYYRPSDRLAEFIVLPGRRDANDGVESRDEAGSSRFLLLSVLLSASTLIYGWWMLHPPMQVQVPQPNPTVVVKQKQPPKEPAPVKVKPKYRNELPEELRFVDVNRERLVQYLSGKSSLLAEEPYLSTILNAAKDNDIHPLLLFAITGQEQAFVPKTDKNAKKIANNPFNVFHSWREFNTTISESARIASNTILHRSQGRPDEMDAIAWINKKYAEDVNWHKGVRSILEAMKRQIMTVNER